MPPNPSKREILERLRAGREVWNGWREETGNVYFELNGVDLRGAKLQGFNLRAAHLDSANLEGANLTRADLSHADLVGANLKNAILVEANLSSAHVVEANLSGADLSEANLSSSYLVRADLSGVDLGDANLNFAILHAANLSGAILMRTVLTAVNLSSAVGLDRCLHWGPSSLDFRTFAMSGDLPREFLRGTGQPETLIDYMPSVLTDAIQLESCFISYSTKDEEFAKILYQELQSNGVRCWYAPENLKTREKFRNSIDRAIQSHDRLLLVLSRDSVKSDWVEAEVEAALERERKEGRIVLFPVRLDDTVMEVTTGWPALVRRNRHIGDFRQWRDKEEHEKSFERLIRDLRPATADVPLYYHAFPHSRKT